MCGIAGFWGPPDSALLAAMTISLRHRGPDDDGLYEDKVASLGFRRLSIIDLEHGNQPMSMDGGRLQMVYNGEVYNYRELRRELEAKGRRFRSATDNNIFGSSTNANAGTLRTSVSSRQSRGLSV